MPIADLPHVLTLKNSKFSPQCAFVRFIWTSEKTAVIFLQTSDRFLWPKWNVFTRAVRAKSLNIIQVNFWLHSAAHTIFVYGALKIR
jgi:hypothetical protein